jgi:hypothetical protein
MCLKIGDGAGEHERRPFAKPACEVPITVVLFACRRTTSTPFEGRCKPSARFAGNGHDIPFGVEKVPMHELQGVRGGIAARSSSVAIPARSFVSVAPEEASLGPSYASAAFMRAAAPAALIALALASAVTADAPKAPTDSLNQSSSASVLVTPPPMRVAELAESIASGSIADRGRSGVSVALSGTSFANLLGSSGGIPLSAPSSATIRSSPFAPITFGPLGFTTRVLDDRDRRWAGSDRPSNGFDRTEPGSAGDPIVMASGGGGDGNNSLIAPLSGGYDIGTEQVPSFIDEPVDGDNSNPIVVPLPTPVLLTAFGLLTAVAFRSGLLRRLQRT